MMILSWQIDFARPLWLAVLAGLPLWIIFWRRSLLRLTAGCRVVSILLRTMLLASVAAALAGPIAAGPANEKVVYGSGTHVSGTPPPIELIAPDHVRAGE